MSHAQFYLVRMLCAGLVYIGRSGGRADLTTMGRFSDRKSIFSAVRTKSMAPYHKELLLTYIVL